MAKPVCIIGGGPAGLIAAEFLARAGRFVIVFDRMPSPARKFLMAGRGGLNLTHSEPPEKFLTRYGEAAQNLAEAINRFSPTSLRNWAEGLDEDTFVGSSGRIFPKSFKASPLLRAWLRRLDGLGVQIRARHSWQGWDADGNVLFDTPDGRIGVKPEATLLSLGGASWPRLGSNAAWVPLIEARGVPVRSFEPANSGIGCDWSDVFCDRFAGQPVKRVRARIGKDVSEGEMIVTRSGLEGGAIYALSNSIRTALRSGDARLTLDLKPDLSPSDIVHRLTRARRRDTATNVLRKTLNLHPVQIGLLREGVGKALPEKPDELSALVKALPLTITSVQGLDRAISSAGGVAFDAVDEHFMLRGLPGTFAAGEMLDWEAPTGGYLLQASFSTGIAAAEGILRWLDQNQPAGP
ncbi:TIGR03862 family flavoprotein [Terrihabitans sp. B22-R8]|uniref:TIGR03862 family flavoprotein n=1 Tax=Terrihabitans sp. B22-R8 TaxID=3425128 RepID=UPI00403CECEC